MNELIRELEHWLAERHKITSDLGKHDTDTAAEILILETALVDRISPLLWEIRKACQEPPHHA